MVDELYFFAARRGYPFEVVLIDFYRYNFNALDKFNERIECSTNPTKQNYVRFGIVAEWRAFSMTVYRILYVYKICLTEKIRLDFEVRKYTQKSQQVY